MIPSISGVTQPGFALYRFWVLFYVTLLNLCTGLRNTLMSRCQFNVVSSQILKSHTRNNVSQQKRLIWTYKAGQDAKLF